MTGHRVFLLLIGAAIFVVGGLGWLLGISPVLSSASQAASDTQTVLIDNATHQAKVDALKVLYDDLPQLRKDLASLQRVIPDAPAHDELLDQIASAAASTGVTILTINALEAQPFVTIVAVPEPATPEEGASEPTPAPTETEEPAAPPAPDAATKLFTLPISITVSGPPDSIVAFVDKMQVGKRLFLVDAAGFTAGAAAPASTGTVSGFIFVLRDPAALAYSSVDASQPEPATDPTPTPAPTEEPAE